jgi:hypothetical protein
VQARPTQKTTQKARTAQRRRAVHSRDADIIAEDTLVFFNKKPSPASPAKASAEPGVKRYSDRN